MKANDVKETLRKWYNRLSGWILQWGKNVLVLAGVVGLVTLVLSLLATAVGLALAGIVLSMMGVSLVGLAALGICIKILETLAPAWKWIAQLVLGLVLTVTIVALAVGVFAPIVHWGITQVTNQKWPGIELPSIIRTVEVEKVVREYYPAPETEDAAAAAQEAADSALQAASDARYAARRGL